MLTAAIFDVLTFSLPVLACHSYLSCRDRARLPVSYLRLNSSFLTDFLTVDERLVALCRVVGATPVSGAHSAHCVR